MNKLFYLLIIPLFSIVFQSCNDDVESYTEWRKENEAYIEEIKSKAEDSNSEYYTATIPGGPGSIYYKILKKGDGNISPISTSVVNIRHKGWLANNNKVFEDASSRTISTSVNDFSTSSKITRGHYVALQNMQAGDKWEVTIPWELGYGATGYGSIVPPYSALIFELELINISEL